MRIDLKNKKKLIFAGLILTAVLFYLIPKFFGSTKYQSGQLEVSKVPLKTLATLDNNTNGIPDWEEALWGLDPYTNGEENKKYIDEKKKIGLSSEGNSESTKNENLNETEEFAQDLFSTIATLKAGGALTQENIASLSEKVSSSVAGNVILPDKYTITDVKISKISSKTAIYNYFNQMTAVLKKYNNKGMGYELKVLAAATNTDNGAGIDELKTIAEVYFSLSNELKALTVPAEVALYHVNLLNDLINVGIATRNMADLYSNSIIGSIGISQYGKYSDELTNDFSVLQIFFAQNGVVSN